MISIAVVATFYAKQIGEYKDTIADMNNTIGKERQTIDLLVQDMIEATFLDEILERAVYVEQGDDEVLVNLVISKDDLETLREHGIDIVPGGNITTTELYKV